MTPRRETTPRPGPGRCPSCGGRLLWKRYAKPTPGTANPALGALMPLDAAPRDTADEYANYAVDAAIPGCRLITPEAPFDPATERRHTIHHATHPACSDHLRNTP